LGFFAVKYEPSVSIVEFARLSVGLSASVSAEPLNVPVSVA